jgi:hypothetical protein
VKDTGHLNLGTLKVNKYELLTTCKKNGQSQDSKTNVSICPHWTTARKTEEKMVGD